MLRLFTVAGLVAGAASSAVIAHDQHSQNPSGKNPTALGHAPIGVMGDHLHKKGELMLSYRYMRMDMGGNRIGRDSVSPEVIATTIPNRFFGAPMQPPTLRVVPLTMDMDMHMIGAMYAPTDWLTLMVMGMYQESTMDHVTFQGGMGTTRLGTFTTETSDFGDTSLTALLRVFDAGQHKMHVGIGVSLPTGTQSEEDQILTPMGGMPTVRLPYPMQIGTGTTDLLLNATYTGRASDMAWGAQYSGRIHNGSNDNDYRFGDRHQVSAWAGYGLADWISVSGRATAATVGRIDGQDTRIMGPVQTANPDFQGGETLTLSGGVNFLVTNGALQGNRFAIELGVPVWQDLNGPQMDTNWTLTAGWQLAF